MSTKSAATAPQSSNQHETEAPSTAVKGVPAPISPLDGYQKEPARSPRTRGWTTQSKLLMVGGALLAAVLITVAAVVAVSSSDPTKDLIFAKAVRQPVTVTVNERGALDSQANVDVVCTVKARNQQSQNATTIKRLLVDDGQKVHGPPQKRAAVTALALGFTPMGPTVLGSFAPFLVPGEMLIELDASGLEDQLKTENITRDNAKLAWDQAESDLIVCINQNDSDQQKALTDLKLAELDLSKYKEADFPAKQENYKNLKAQAEDRVNYDQRMVKKSFMSPSQLQSDQFAFQKADLDLKGLKYEYERQITQYQRAVEEFLRNVERVKETTKSKYNTALKTRDSKRGVFEQEQRRSDEIKEEIGKCRVYAKQSGMVVYVIPEQARFGGGSQQSIIAQGEPVREGQKMMKIPDLTKMMVTCKVHEALVASVRMGQRVSIRLDALSGKTLHGKVVAVATVDSKQDWMQADVKVYLTTINIDSEDTIPGLKPGMSADVSIEVDRSKGPVLTIPVEAIIDSMEDDDPPYCFVKTKEGGVAKRSVTVGISNGKIAEIKTGLEEGEDVVVNPVKLLKDDEKKKLTQRVGEEQKSKGKPGKKDKPAGNLAPPSAGGAGPQGAPGASRPQPTPAQIQAFQKMTPEQQKEALKKLGTGPKS